MMWVSFTMDGNRQKNKWLVVEHKALKLAKTNNVPSKDTLTGSHGRCNDYDIEFTIMMIIK